MIHLVLEILIAAAVVVVAVAVVAIGEDTFCFLVYYYFNYGFSTVSLLCLYTLLVLFLGSWFAYSEAYGTVWLDFDDMAVKHFY